MTPEQLPNEYYECLFHSERRLKVGGMYRVTNKYNRQWQHTDPGLIKRWNNDRSRNVLVLSETPYDEDAYPDIKRESSYQYTVLCGGEIDLVLLMIRVSDYTCCLPHYPFKAL
jgi:hypothetical protein